MITIKADFNHLDAKGRLLLDDLAMHRETPFGEIAANHDRVIFVDGTDLVEGRLVSDPAQGWVGAADWATQGEWESHPAQVKAG
jgi:hypothetical protein